MSAFLVPTSLGLMGKACAVEEMSQYSCSKVRSRKSYSPECKCSIIGSSSQNSSLQSAH